MKNANHISYLLGKTLSEVRRDEEQIFFTVLEEGATYRLFHDQACCENVQIESIVGDLQDLVGHPILLSEESAYKPETTEYRSQTWTFYKLATIKGYVDIRFHGESNGYYSESVSFERFDTA